MLSGFYAYVYFDPRIDLPFYVGKGQKYRARKHLHQCHNPQVTRRLADLKASGLAPEIQLYPTSNEDAALDLERDLIALYGRLIDKTGHLLNILEGGDKSDGFRGRRHTPEAKAKIRAAHKARVWSPEQRANVSAAAKRRTFNQLAKDRSLAARQSPESRKRMSERMKRTQIPDQLAAMTERAAQVNRGCKRSPEHRAAISAAVKARVITAETRAKMSVAQKRRYAR